MLQTGNRPMNDGGREINDHRLLKIGREVSFEPAVARR